MIIVGAKPVVEVARLLFRHSMINLVLASYRYHHHSDRVGVVQVQDTALSTR